MLSLGGTKYFRKGLYIAGVIDPYPSNLLIMNRDPNIEAAATLLREAAFSRRYCQPVRHLIGETDLETAYAVQALNTAERIAGGAKVIGCKIGLTSPAVQKQLGVDQPDFGMLFNDMELWNGSRVSMQELMQPKVEAEIAFVLKKDLDRDTIGTADVLSAIEYALVALEVVGSRIEHWNIKITDTIADNASASHFVLGHRPVSIRDIDLTACKMILNKNQREASTGQGSACLGSPVNALVWLARRMKETGTPMRAGQVILSGALGPMVEVQAGDHIEAVIEGLGSVSVAFTK